LGQPREGIVAADLSALLGTLLATLTAARDEVDALNVFPVPDGDTGTNLVQTVQAASDAVQRVHGGTAAQVALAAGRGALRGATGNSGVIFSQVIRALTETLGDEPLGTPGLLAFLARARDLAYEAVAEPAPGTILTAMDAAVEGAARAMGQDLPLPAALEEVARFVGVAVADSRDVLEANRVAGVVDAGARGFEVAVEAFRVFVEGREVPVFHPPPVRRTDGPFVPRESGSLEYAFEVQYLLHAPDEVAPGLRLDLEMLGDSVVVVACGGLLNVHVHTNDIGAALEAGLDRGRPSRVEVTSFADQLAGRVSGGPVDRPEPLQRDDRPAVGYVAVLPGPGLHALARDLGAVPVAGAAGALPNVADILDAVGECRAREIVVLPGNPNVVPTARQASAVSEAEGGRTLHVVDTVTSVPAVLAVLATASRDDLDLDALGTTGREVRAGEVVTAVRDADTPLGPVREGQWLAVAGGDVIGAADEPLTALGVLLGRLDGATGEVVTLVAGADVPADERTDAVALVAAHAVHAEVELVDGGQRPARWIVGVE
jgi:uncharacterized protein